MKVGPASHGRFYGRPIRGHFPSETGWFPSLHALWPLCLYKTPGVRMLPRSIPASSGRCSVGISVTGLGWHGSPQYCRLVSTWMSWQATVGLCNQKAGAVNCITGCNEESDPRNKPSNFYSHLLLFLLLPWRKDPF